MKINLPILHQYPKRPSQFFRALIRKKKVDENSLSETQLNRCLTTLDLTFLGIGSTLGLGIYVLSGKVASTTAGPSVILSFLIAALASVFAALCYAEFGSRVPKAGSAYIYSYVTVGEMMAFIIGWNLILEYAIGTASVARGYSNYIDSIFGGKMERYLNETLPLNIPHLSSYPDFLSLAITLCLTALMAVGVKESTKFNNVFTTVNLLVVLYVIICGSFKIDFHNWNLRKDEVPKGQAGGFFPFGLNGMLAGASTCFYGFVGFDCIATTGEEVKNPRRAIPISIIISLVVVFLAYFGVSSIETLMAPYYLQDQSAPLPYVFKKVGYPIAAYIITGGALFGLSTSLLGGMFPLPRVIYAMSKDGLIFSFLSTISQKFKTPLIATIISGLLTGSMAMLFDVKELADMMSIGTLLAYTLVAVSILFLRYQMDQFGTVTEGSTSTNTEINRGGRVLHQYGTDAPNMAPNVKPYTQRELVRCLFFNLDKLKTANHASSFASKILILFLILLIILVNCMVVFLREALLEFIGYQVLLAILLVYILVATIDLCALPSSIPQISFKVPFVPVVPLLSVFANVLLMLNLSGMTWIRFGVWMALGMLIYFFYGIWKSTLNIGTTASTNVPAPTQTLMMPSTKYVEESVP